MDARNNIAAAQNNTLNCGPLEYLPHTEFNRRIAAAEPGEIIVYATGDLSTALRMNPDQRKGLGDLMHVVRRASAEGVVYLTQQRHNLSYIYRAQKARRQTNA